MSIAHLFDKALLIGIFLKNKSVSSSFLVNVSDNGKMSWAMIGEADFIDYYRKKMYCYKDGKA